MDFPGGSMVKNLPAMQEMWVRSLGWEDPLEKEMATVSCVLAWEILWTEESGGLWSMGSQQKSRTRLSDWTATRKTQKNKVWGGQWWTLAGDGVVDQRMVSYEVSRLLKEECCMLAQTEGGPKFRGLEEGETPSEHLISKFCSDWSVHEQREDIWRNSLCPCHR